MKRWISLLLVLLMMGGMVTAAAEETKDMRNFVFEDEIPAELTRAPKQKGGTVTKFAYPSKDYTNDQAEITKFAALYLPPDYSEDNRYDLLVLCHGIGGTELEWGFMNAYSIGRNVLDNLILKGIIPPMIVVMPNGRSTAKAYNTGFDNMGSFYVFGQELRNDLLPYVDAHYATYGHDIQDDLAASRNHRAMAGLSMGSMQTINIGLCECLDLFSMFGAFSAAPTSNPAATVAQKLKDFPDYPVRYFYSVCGTEDSTAYGAASAAAKELPKHTDRLTDENWHWQERSGGHDFAIWNLGLYNFARVMGELHE